MNTSENQFRKTITRFGGLPGILVPLGIILWCSGRSLYQRLSTNPYRQSSLLSGNHLYEIESALRAVWIGFGGVFMSYSIGTVIKYFYYKPRPIPRDTSTLRKRINASSIPSIHASNGLITAVALVIAVASLPADLEQYPRAILAIYGYIILGFFYYLSIALSRIALQKHYPIDVLAGTILGVVISIGLFFSYGFVIDLIEQVILLFL